MTKQRTETLLAQIGNQSCERTGAINTPVYFSTAYKHRDIGSSTGFDYIRTKNPTRSILEEAMAKLEEGDRAFACSSGMSAIQLVATLFKTGDHIVAIRDLYGGTYRVFDILTEQYGITFSFWDGKCVADLTNLLKQSTKALFIETPTNPLMNEVDLTSVGKIAQAHNLLFIVDNTFFTPVIQKPMDVGADIVIHSATKYLAGHNDVLAGIVVAKGEKLCDQLAHFHNGFGPVLSPFDSWLVIRGLKTLALRMKQHEYNAQAIKRYLQKHPLVSDVYYPGKGGMISFKLTDEAYVSPFLRNLRLFTFAESLGGVESLITYPATQTHADIPEEIRASYGLCNRLIRISTGIEHNADLINDLKVAFTALQGEVNE